MLKALVPEIVTLHTIEGAGHNNLPEFPEYHDLLYDMLHDAFEGELKMAA